MKDSAYLLQDHILEPIQNDPKIISQLVLAAESGDLEFFQKEVQNIPNIEALVLGFVYAIYEERITILQFYYSAGYIAQISSRLFKNPMITAATKDSIKSFEFFVQQGLPLPVDILGPLFHNNAKSIVSYIINDDRLSREISETRFETPWSVKALANKDNEAVRIFKDFLKYNELANGR